MNQNINIDLNKSEPINLNTQKKKEKKRKVLIGNLLFICLMFFAAIASFAIFAVNESIPLVIAGVVFLVSGILLSVRKKLGLILAYIISFAPIVLWVFVGIKILIEAIQYSVNSAEIESIIAMAPVCLISIIWSILYLIYYTKRRKYFK